MLSISRWLNLALPLVLVCTVAPAGDETLPLAKDWRLQSSAEVSATGGALSTPGCNVAGWHTTTVPRTVLAALVDNGVYPDPYYGLNMKAVDGYQDGPWIVMPDDSPFDVPWWYRVEFELPAAFKGKHLVLHLDGVNYEANIWLNGNQIASNSDVIGMFRRFEFDVTGGVRFDGPNALAVQVIPPGQLTGEIPRTKQLEATTGWDDHNPQPPDMNLGIWEDVYVTATGPAYLRHPYVHADLEVPALDKARLTVSAYVTNTTSEALTATVRGTIEAISFEQEVSLQANETRLVEFGPDAFDQLNLANPRVWWPNPLGPQELYEADLSCSVAGDVSDTAHTRFGIRKATSYINDEGWRTYQINGHNVLIRGGAWMTSDMLLRFNHRLYDGLIRYAREANLNMLRSEGFSIRETDEFYNLCDEYGVMVTQQIFGRNIPDEDLAVACIEDMMLRIRTHPSLVHFLGHDETFPTETLDAAYQGLIKKHRVDRTYQPHSGAFNVKKRFETGGTRTGTRQLWTYANPSQYYVGKNDGAWGFAQSGGIGGIVAPYDSVRRMIPKDQEWPLWTEATSFHTVIQGGEFFFSTVVQMADARYGESDGLETFCTKAHAMDYEGARGMYEAYARNKYSSTGITTWKYNVAWPAFMTWAYVDWYLNTTGAYYGAKKACEELHPQYSYDDHSIYVVNSLYKPFNDLTVTAKVFNFDLTEKYTRTATVSVEPDGKVNAFTIDWPDGLSKSHFLVLTLDDAAGNRVTDNFYWLSTVPDVPGKMRLDWRNYSVEPKSIADHTDLNTLPPIELNATATFTQDGDETVAQVTVENPGPHLAFQVRLAVLKGDSGWEVTPVFWEENFISLFPGEKREITGRFYTRDLEGASPTFKVSGWNVR